MNYIIPFFSLFILLLCLYFTDRRSLKYGIVFICSILNFFVIAILYISNSDFFNDTSNIWIRIIYIFLALCIIFTIIGPSLLIIILITKGFQLLKKEGQSFKNLLSLIAGFFLLFINIFSSQILSVLHDYSIWFYIYILIMLYIYYLLILSSIYTVSSFLNFINLKKNNLSYIIILGSGLIGDKVTPLLANRINKGIEVYKFNPHSKIIMSGGQGDDEIIAESEAMKRYAIEQGVPSEDIKIENQSTNTEENLIFSYRLIPDGFKVAIVTNYYHIFRALVIARDNHIPCIGYGAHTKLYFSLNAFIREFIGYLYLKRKFHLVILILFTIIYIILVILSKVYIR
ncbi:YdcF family protein [Mammaliicoccus sciuri]|uniref:YdcF family protein n=1 Tax=Mammaliicoccus sciuri TaxID=1296 RepID=UPI001FB3F8F2|nr:YdcF family protein [Mammaliicoccus sciuri]MCJ1785652.1 YdcF family protein [Mammaliicoccus sciuri]